MKLVVLAAAALPLCACASYAGRGPSPAQTNAVVANAVVAKAAVAIGRDGQDTRHRCSAENPNIEYRDCVNASTRDPNAKVRMG